MRKSIALLLVLCSIFALCACGEGTKTPVQLVEEQIDALGEISLESRDAIEAAEAAYAALTPEEQAQVRNVAVLQAARLVYDDAAAKQAAADAEAARLAAMEPFVGTWVVEFPTVTWSFELRADGSYVEDSVTGVWSCDPAAGLLYAGEVRYVIFEEDGFTKIRADSEDGSLAYVKAEDLDAARAKKYVAVELNSENVRDIIGDPIRVGLMKDEWGNPNPEWPVFYFSNLYYAQGLVYVASEDVAIELTDGGINGPGYFYWLQNAPAVSGRAKGTLWFIRDGYVAENKLVKDESCDYDVRLILTGGEMYLTYWGVPETAVEGGYADVIEFYEDHKF